MVFQASVFLRFIRLSIIRLFNFMPVPAVPEMQHASERSPGLSMCQHEAVFFRRSAIPVRLKVPTTTTQRHEEEQMPDAMIFVPLWLSLLFTCLQQEWQRAVFTNELRTSELFKIGADSDASTKMCGTIRAMPQAVTLCRVAAKKTLSSSGPASSHPDSLVA